MRHLQDLQLPTASILKDDNNQLKVDAAARIIGSGKALSKQGLSTDFALDPNPKTRAVAFCQKTIKTLCDVTVHGRIKQLKAA